MFTALTYALLSLSLLQTSADAAAVDIQAPPASTAAVSAPVPEAARPAEGNPSEAAEKVDAEEDEIWTLDEIAEDDALQNQAEQTFFDEVLLKYAPKKLVVFAPEPPEDPSEYAVALADMMTTPAAKLFSYATYKGKLPNENVGQNIRLGDSEVRIATLDIYEDGTEVGKYYARELASQGIVPVINQLADNVVYFSWHGDDGFMRTITLVAQTDNHTVALASVSDARKVFEGLIGFEKENDLPKAPSKMWDDWREPPSEGRPFVLENSEGSTRQVTRKITVRANSAQEIMNQYVRDLTMAGWSISADFVPPKDDAGLWKVFEKPAEGKQCMLSIIESQDPGLFESLVLCSDSN